MNTDTSNGATDIIIGLDLGTTSCKAVALTSAGGVEGVVRRSYPLHAPKEGWAEQDVEEVWQAAREALAELSGRIAKERIKGLALSGAMHSLLPVDSSGTPLALAMTWADARAAPKLVALRGETDADALYRRTGCPLQTPYHPPRLRWWLSERPAVADQAERFVAIKDWGLFRLTGAWATDTGLASTTGLLDIHTLSWDEGALALSGISAGRLPELVPSETVVGGLQQRAAEETGLPAGLPVVAGGSDGALANLGSGAADDRQTVITVGTSGAVRRVVRTPLLDERGRTWCYVLRKARYVAGGAVNNGGLVVEWARRLLYSDIEGEAGFERLFRDASSVPPGAAGLLFLPYLAGERSPHWRSDLPATLHGLSLHHDRRHLARAALEGVAYALADVWRILDEQAPNSGDVRLSGGITGSEVWSQTLADVLGVPLTLMDGADASAVGAAMIGHLALATSELETLTKGLPKGGTLTPDAARHAEYGREMETYCALYRTLHGGEGVEKPKTKGTL